MREVRRAAKPTRGGDRGGGHPVVGARPAGWRRRVPWLLAVAVGVLTMAVAARTPDATQAAPAASTGTSTTAAPATAPTAAPALAAPTTATPAAVVTTGVASTAPIPVVTEAAATTLAPTTTDAAAPSTTVTPAATVAPSTTRAPRIEADVAEVTLSSVPADLLLPTSEATLDPARNPINGRRSLTRPAGRAPFGCTVDPDAPQPCLLGTLDGLGFDVGGPDDASRARRVRQAVAALQLDAGQRATGRPDQAFYEYVGAWPGSESLGAADVRRLGTSAQGRPIVARRYGSGPRVVLVVGQTHGDEEAGVRLALRLARQPVPAGVTLWVVPTMNPDGLAGDTRFLANGADPNRKAPEQPEQRAVHDLAVATRPALAVYYHQNYAWVGGSGASMDPAARYHELTGLGPLYNSGDCALGFLWCPIDDAVGSSSILVELPDVVTPGDVRAHAAALLAVAAG